MANESTKTVQITGRQMGVDEDEFKSKRAEASKWAEASKNPVCRPEVSCKSDTRCKWAEASNEKMVRPLARPNATRRNLRDTSCRPVNVLVNTAMSNFSKAHRKALHWKMATSRVATNTGAAATNATEAMIVKVVAIVLATRRCEALLRSLLCSLCVSLLVFVLLCCWWCRLLRLPKSVVNAVDVASLTRNHDKLQKFLQSQMLGTPHTNCNSSERESASKTRRDEVLVVGLAPDIVISPNRAQATKIDIVISPNRALAPRYRDIASQQPIKSATTLGSTLPDTPCALVG